MKLQAKKVSELTGQQAKCYALKIAGKVLKKDEGVKKSVVEKELMIEDYKVVLFSGIPQHQRLT